ncbi:MAG: heme exporter protein CcmD [Sphingomonas sp.]|nr:MAG: heme exporter protein CcmD [Sphingomonas sp.]
MPHLPFIIAAYGITIAALGGFLLWSVMRLRRAERALEDRG